jgi:hypothetical protein
MRSWRSTHETPARLPPPTQRSGPSPAPTTVPRSTLPTRSNPIEAGCVDPLRPEAICARGRPCSARHSSPRSNPGVVRSRGLAFASRRRKAGSASVDAVERRHAWSAHHLQTRTGSVRPDRRRADRARRPHIRRGRTAPEEEHEPSSGGGDHYEKRRRPQALPRVILRLVMRCSPGLAPLSAPI